MAKNFESILPFKKKQKINQEKQQRALKEAIGIDHKANRKPSRPLSKSGLAALFAKNSK